MLKNSFVFRNHNCWPMIRPKYPKKYKNPNIWQKKRKVNGSAGETQVCNFSGFYLSKTAWTSDSEGIWGDKLEPACMYVPVGTMYYPNIPDVPQTLLLLLWYAHAVRTAAFILLLPLAAGNRMLHGTHYFCS